jgi:hypothetical protein
MSKNKKEDKITEILIEEPLGDDDIKRYLPEAKVMRYSSLRNIRDIKQLLPNEIDYAILLYEDSPNKGHWVAVMRYGDTIEFFDSYGGEPDKPLSWNNSHINQKLNQEPYLSRLFDKTDMEVVYSPTKFQGDGDDINTCGRHTVFRILNLIEKDRPLGEYYKIMNEIKKETKSSYDDIVANLINII